MLQVETFCDHPNHANTYLVENNHSVIIIDPANHMKTLESFIGEKKVEAVFLTHGHFDHFRMLKEVLEKYPVKCYLHPKAVDKITNLVDSCAGFFGIKNLPIMDEKRLIKVTDNQVISLPNFQVKVLYTPGHTNCSVVYLIDDCMFSGDTLFRNSVGRTDLPTGSIMALDNSLKRLKGLKTNYIIYPGHDACTSMDDELKNNHYLR